MVKYYIYKAIDVDGNVLYVGQTIDIDSRMKTHSSSSDWWNKKKSILIAEIPNKTVMNIYEEYYINKLKPIYNIAMARKDDVSFIKINDLLNYFD